MVERRDRKIHFVQLVLFPTIWSNAAAGLVPVAVHGGGGGRVVVLEEGRDGAYQNGGGAMI